jgi:hypothetical protein
MLQNLCRELTGLDKISRIFCDEGCGGQVKRSTGTVTTSFRMGRYTSTIGVYDNHFFLDVVILRSGEDEGSTKYPSTTIGTTTRIRSEDNSGVGNV